ncbi:MAG: PAS domain S-box protein [Verrucomicrobiales bacterium]|nr:PAS domain S-box protein [Verrucomicrobiales bacterium]
MSEIELLQRRLSRERLARKEAERLLEEKSRALFETNLKLQEHATHLEAEITERKRTEARFRNITESLAEGLLLVAPDGVILYANQRMTNLIGHSPGELLGKTIRDLVVPAAEGQPARAQFWEFEDTGPVCITADLELCHKDGHRLTAQVHAAPYYDSSGTCRAMIGALTDISDRRRAEAELVRLNDRLVEASRLAGMAEVATGVLHNVGNVLNSVNVSSTLIRDQLRQSRLSHLLRAIALLREHEANLPDFLSRDPRGRQLPAFLQLVTTHLQEENLRLLKEADGLDANLQHIKHIVAMQQSFARVGGAEETIAARDLLEQAIELHTGALQRDHIELIRHYQAHPTLLVDRHKVVQILVNFLRNARHALAEAKVPTPTITVLLETTPEQTVRLAVTDNGIGIPTENLTRIFSHGFTTKRDGHGFGLHSGALAAREMGGRITVASEGPGRGATFALELPAGAASRNPLRPPG